MLSRRRSSPWIFAVSLGAVAAVLAAACGSSATTTRSTPVNEVAASDAPTPDLARYYGQQLSWGSCSPFSKTQDSAQPFADPKYDCAYLEVPLDYAKPDGDTAKLAVIRQKATTGPKIGSLLFNPGGPGGSGTEYLPAVSKQVGTGTLAQRFDLVGFDPRGVSASTPQLDCLTDKEQDEERIKVFADPSPAGVAAAEADAKSQADRCSARMGNQVLANVGTRDVVKDLDVLRTALGDEKLSFYGYSYGTQIASAYAEAFPQNVRALVLDGVVDPRQDYVESSIKQAAGFQQAFDAFAKWCTTQANCPLGTDPARTTQTFNALAQRLITTPIPSGDPARPLGFNDAVLGVTQALYVRQLWPALAQGISGMATNDGALLMTLADIYYSRGADGKYSNSIEAFTAISCVDSGGVSDPARVKQLTDGVYAAAPYRATGKGPVEARETCAFWPVPPTSTPHTPHAPGIPQTMVVSVTGDPATPYQAGVDVAKDLGSTLITVNGTQHTAGLQGTKCIDDKLTAYLVDPATKQQPATCTVAA
ncbi:alpha/beta hydrolase [Pseudonocardia sp. T1-2H]|uniref:alpha/beta hydrolase n=1 Tax=Pseudonocardia sp. T1-2H TaxID=3128899 RepID=UPI003101B171